MIIDATNLILGRIATIAAKKALLGETVDIINCEKAVITGLRKTILEKYQRKSAMGSPSTGPYIARMFDKFVKRALRGMIPYKQPKGVAALKRLMCYSGVPEEFKDKKAETIEEANISKLANLNFVTVKEICLNLGGNL